MTYEDIVFDYNNRALDAHTWDMISDRERVEFVLRVRGMQEPVAWSRLDTAKSVITENEDIKRGWDLDGLPFKCLFDSPQPCPECDKLKKQVSAYKNLTGSLEKRIAHHSAKADEYRAAIATLESERQSNEILTVECEKLKAELAGWKLTLDQVISETAKELGCQADNEEILATIDKLKALSVTNILIDVVPGDGNGLEVYAKSVSEVEDLLSRLGEKAEDYDLLKPEYEKLKAGLPIRDQFFCADCQDTGWLENREEGKYPCTCMTEAEPYQLLKAERDITANILNRVRYEAHLEAADLVIDLGDDSSTLDERTLTVAANAIRALGTGMEAGK